MNTSGQEPRPQWAEVLDTINAWPHPPQLLQRRPGDDLVVTDYLMWLRWFARRGSAAWGQCAAPTWALSWPGQQGPHRPVIVYGRRPTPRRLARLAPCTCGPDPPDPSTVADALHTELPSPPIGLLHRARHRLWWFRYGHVRAIARGDIRLTVAALPQQPRPQRSWEPATRRYDLSTEHDYAELIHLAATTDLWVRRRPRLRHVVQVSHLAPEPPRWRRWLLHAHRHLGDLTWAPPPPGPRIARRPPARRGPIQYTHHYQGSWLARGGGGPMPPGYHPLPPHLVNPKTRR